MVSASNHRFALSIEDIYTINKISLWIVSSLDMASKRYFPHFDNYFSVFDVNIRVEKIP